MPSIPRPVHLTMTRAEARRHGWNRIHPGRRSLLGRIVKAQIEESKRRRTKGAR